MTDDSIDLIDPAIFNDWHVAACSDAVTVGGSPMAATLLEQPLVLWRSADGVVHAWSDRCPHRGAAFSLGRVADDRLVCPYHGWRFAASGEVTLKPATPSGQPAPSGRGASAQAFQVRERYGLVWVCLGQPAHDIIPFREFDAHPERAVYAGPYDVRACGPRVVENFIDMAHFPFVHEGTLGSADDTALAPYSAETFTDGTGLRGVRTAGLRVTQPRPHAHATEPADVEYTYRISRPLSAILTKHASHSTAPEAIALFAQPVNEFLTRVWILMLPEPSAKSRAEVRAYQDAIFTQDAPIVESQRPARLPLRSIGEHAQPADALSVAYRRYLLQMHVRFGVVT